MGAEAFALQDYGGGGESSSGSISQTQTRRSAERFNILDFIRSQQSAVNAQNMKYGRGGSASRGAWPDLVLRYMQDTGPVLVNGLTIGNDSRAAGRIQFLLDDLFTKGTRTKSLNIDLGAEGFLSQTTSFSASTTSGQVVHTYNETGGGLLIRPFGRSSQDTGLLVKGGYMNLTETGLWGNTQTQYSMYAPYLGAEVKLYLLNFLGIYGDYQNALETQVNALNSKWKMQRFRYGAFLEIYLLSLGIYLDSTEMVLTNSSGGFNKENYSGVGLTAALYF